MPDLTKAREAMAIDLPLLAWYAVYAACTVALRTDDIERGDARGLVESFTGQLGGLLVEQGFLSADELRAFPQRGPG